MRRTGPESLGEGLVEQFRRTPDARAVSDDREVLTYRELDARSAALAERLVEAGVGPDRVVALQLERSTDLAVAIVGVLRAGGAWLPLSTTDPDRRILGLLRDAAPAAVITEENSRLWSLAGSAVPRLTPRGPRGPGRAQPIDSAAPHHLAYVIYTSGSTGRPKGVMTEHAAIVNRLRWMQERFPVGPGDVIAQKTPYTFDVSVWEFIWPLATGAELAFAAPDGHRDPAYLQSFLTERQVTVTHFVPSMLTEFLRRARPGSCPRLRAVMVSGEALGPDLVRRFFERLPHAELHNLYGPTEAAVDVSHWQCSADDPPTAPVPIGHPITGIELLVVGEDGVEVPAGEVGELCIAGVGVARGYLNLPDVTAERFVEHPADPGRRMYRTGDLASRRPDGAFLYHGRNDRQVKIGGVRVELGEVEAALHSLPGVEECVVVTRVDGAGVVRLDAAAVPVPGVPWSGWRDELLGILPAGSVPATLTPVDSLPKTAHGKSDTEALRAILEERSEQGARADDPVVEDSLERLWARVLGTTDPDFLHAGGTSLHAVRLLADVAEEFGAGVPLSDFFADPTLDRLRALVAAGGTAAAEAPSRVPREGGLSLNSYQERLWFLQELEPGSTAMSAPTAFRITGTSAERVSEAFAALVRRHEVLRTRFQSVEGVPRAVIGSDAPALQWTDRADGAAGPETVRRLVEELAYEPFDLAAGPPLRARGVGFGPSDHLLVMVTHQIVADGWTWSLLADELTRLLTRPDASEEARLQIVDQAAWQRTQESRPEHRAAVEESLGHWRAVLANAPDGLDLPVDEPREPSLSVPADSVALHWSADFASRLKALCRAQGLTEFMALLAGYTAWLARLSGQETVVVGTPMANRAPAWIADLVGYFVTTVPQCLEIDEDATVAQVLDRARTSVLAGQRHSTAPIERIVAEVGPARGAARLPLFQNLFVFQNMPAWRREADGVAVQVHQFPPRHTHYDLKFEVFPLTTGYEARLVYARGRFSAERAALMARQLASFVETAVDKPDAYVDEIGL
ncbi:amino acid adenylation domain-containing protein [Streptomyces sp. NBC_01341]|uniref:amino acid adenylation domain-containing protein n=1 Tax=Streptomyces sp. NBC_01341 TaxID=2903831 RepID=UPI002E0F7F98|nr:amino acid adenylation domain-containing protein [Streptomyces sp. NBC_01341]